MTAKKLKKRLLVTTLALAVACTFAVPALAETTTYYADEQTVIATDVKATSWTSSKLKKAKLNLIKVASCSYDKIKLTWEPLSGVDGYQIYRATSKSGTYKKISTVTDPTKSTYINGSRTCGKTYYYKVRAYKKINGKTVYSKFSSVMSAAPKLAKVTITDAYAPDTAVTTIAIDFKTVRGATDYEGQINQIKDGEETGFRSYTYDYEGVKNTFSTYRSNLALQKKHNPSGYVSVAVVEDGKMTSKRITVEEYAESMIAKNQIKISPVQDDSTYQFRVRAYKTVNGKKIYGPWSDTYTLKEILNIDEIYKELRQYAIDYAAENEPRWHYEDRPTGNPQNSNYYSDGHWADFSIYSRQEDVIEFYKPEIKGYISRVAKQGGYDSGFLYFSKVGTGDWEDHFFRNEGPDIHYNAFMLY
ncbi:MAG: hypothetical protein MR908_09815 [Firmicutes bacterium]|nr:hypothetical protein [Bacillota bacterium]